MKVVAISGSLRRASSNAAMLRALKRVAADGVEIVLYENIADLPHFNPDLDEEGMTPPPPVAELRALLIPAGAIVISSPEYAHGVPGSLKNMLDWLVSTGELVGKRVALLNASPAGGEYAQASLRETLLTMNWNVVDAASRAEPFVRRRITGEVEDEETLDVLRTALTSLTDD